MDSCARCVCCKPCRPRYKRLVDDIYPVNPGDGLIANNMQKLTFYAMRKPEKLDRIGEYLAQRLSRDMYRDRIALVKVSIEAMDKLLTSCHGSPSLNSFVESFLKIIQKILETPNFELQILATNSFVNFCNIDEDTPSYHRRYDFFICKFSSLCHNNHSNIYLKRKLRLAGLRGLRGVVRKTVSDDLQANIWEQQHMDKIVPSLLYNMHDDVEIEDEVDSDSVDEVPKLLADSCFRELTGKASYGSLRFVLQPLLRHFDFHKLWSPPGFAIQTFKAIMYSLQSQYSFLVIQLLMQHLDQHSTQADARIRIGMATVLSETVFIAATACPIGPGLLDIFNNLLRHLRSSVEFEYSDRCRSLDLEKKYQEALINTMGEFAKNLPDYQKAEIMMFIIGKVPVATQNTQLEPSECILRNVLVRTLLKVATKYTTVLLSTVLSHSFLEPLLQLSLAEDPTVRILVQQILHTLLDRHDNLAALEQMRSSGDTGDMKLQVEKCSRSDAIFMKKNNSSVLSALYHSARSANNTAENYDAILYTMALLCIEQGNEDTVQELYQVALALQNLAQEGISYENVNEQTESSLSPDQKAQIHNLVAKYLNLSSQLIAIPALCAHVQHVMKLRSESLPCLDLTGDSGPVEQATEDFILTEELLFDRRAIAEALQSSGHEVSRLSIPFSPRPICDVTRDGGKVEADGSVTSTLDVESTFSSSAGSLGDRTRRLSRFQLPGLPAEGVLTFEQLKEIAYEPMEKFRERELEHCQSILQDYRTLPYKELLARNRQRIAERESGYIAKFLEEYSNKFNEDATDGAAVRSPDRTPTVEDVPQVQIAQKPLTLHEIQFPDLFVF